MKAQLKIECIGDDQQQWGKFYGNMFDDYFGKGAGNRIVGKMPSRCWVAEITGKCIKYKYQRQFLQPNKDYSEANAVGSRGIYAYFILEDGKLYEVSAPQSWKKTDRYFCTVINGKVVNLQPEELDKCLKNT